MENNWFKKLFIDEAKAALDSRSQSDNVVAPETTATYTGEVEVV